MSTPKQFFIVNIPLNRPAVSSFLYDMAAGPRGRNIQIVHQRPTIQAEAEWVERLRIRPDIQSLIARDDPHRNLINTTTDRLIPLEFLKKDEEYLSRNLGGWSPVYFGVIRNMDNTPWKEDPLLAEAIVLQEKGKQIRFYGASSTLTGDRLEQEFGTADVHVVAGAIIKLHEFRKEKAFAGTTDCMLGYADWLYDMLLQAGDDLLVNVEACKMPRALLIDELMGQMVRIEDLRRNSFANNDEETVAEIKEWQSRHLQKSGLMLILKGEYIMGRHRRSIVLIAPELKFVAKQPGPEPFHEAELGSSSYEGKPENMPKLTRDGSLVTSGGRLSLILEEGILEKVCAAFNHPVQLISGLGYIIEPYVTGPTLQEYVLEKPGRMNDELYSYILLHQQVCECLDTENGDWHAANFIVQPENANPLAPGLPQIVHIDWGAARPLTAGELNETAVKQRVNQVQNIAFSFHNAKLAEEVKQLHDRIVADENTMATIRHKAETIAKSVDKA
ncbi:MAG: hypothetical protein LAT67_06855 [Balneolales bacterium]|nr:hypothetical protein [Balneolales bacterium]